MKSPQAVVDDCDDIFGPPRTYPTGYCPPKNRPSMISAKYRLKEERRKVLKISMNKMKKIEDPELSLCRSVLINNTMKRLQREARDEKIQKQQLNYPRCYDNDSIPTIRSEFAKNENKNTINDFADEHQQQAKPQEVEFVVENDFDTKLAEEIKTVTAKNNMDMDFNLTVVAPEPIASRKRSFDEAEDCDVVLSQFYMTPTPIMLTCIDEDEDVVSSPAEPKRPKFEAVATAAEDIKTQDFSVNSFLNNNNLPHQQPESRLMRYTTQNDTDSNSYSCGHASMFSELQSNVYHNLIASLET